MLAPLVTPKGYCAQSPTERHHRVVEVVDVIERETCRHCGDVKEHAAPRWNDQPYYVQPTRPEPELPDGFHWGM